MNSIGDYLNNVFCKFKTYVESNTAPKFCEFKTVNYDLNAFPNYNDTHIQELYLLRYAFAYAFEYKSMYKKIFTESVSLLPETIKILSIGCGNGIDYWSAAQAVDMVKPEIKIDYTGVDKCKWKYRPEKREVDTFRIDNRNAIDYFRKCKELDYHLIVFPKSISEFDDALLGELCAELKKIKITRPYLRLLFSIRENSNNMNEDLEKIDLIVDAFCNNSTIRLMPKNYHKTKCYFVGDKGIISYDSCFRYPDDILLYLTNLHSCCPNFKKHGTSCNDCNVAKLDRRPILKASHIRTKIVYLTEGE